MARKRNQSRDISFFKQYFHQHLPEVLFIASAVLLLFVLIALVTYSQYDMAWSTSGNLTMVHNATGRIGAWVSDVLLYLLGYIAFLLPVFGIYLVVLRIRHRYFSYLEESDFSRLLKIRFVGFLLLILSLSCLFSLHVNPSQTYLPYSAGGLLGTSLGHWVEGRLSIWGTGLILFALFLVGVTFATGLSWMAVMEWLGQWIAKAARSAWEQFLYRLECARERRALKVQQAEEEIDADDPLLAPKPVVRRINVVPPSKPVIAKAPAKKNRAPAVETDDEEEDEGLEDESGLPSVDLLDQPEVSHETGYSEEELERLSNLVEQRLKEFGIDAQVAGVYPGPVITRFELDLAAGTKASKLTGLSRDLARALSVMSVRIVEVIPGKSFVGLEIPNSVRERVNFREVVSSEAYQEAASQLTLALGKDIGGEPFVVDLARMPHLLVAGTTGAGKSVGLNAMLLSILYKSTPEEVRLIMVDPKMLELSIYDGIPHLLTPVITDMKEAANALRWCIGEMDRRYRLMASLGVRNLAGYNTKVQQAIDNDEPLSDPLWPKDNAEEAPELAPLPHLVVLVDEFADMMMVVGKKVEELITRLAQKARAAGIHLILATQRPSVDVITGLIKANVPARIAFQTSSRIDSRTILDQQGAEQLLGHGDMLYMAAGTMPTRVHGAFVADHEVHAVVNFLKEQGEPDYLSEVLEDEESDDDEGGSNGDATEEVDALFDQAVEIVAKTRRASISNVQRRLKIGYNRAARILEQMEAQGMVTPMESNGTREVLLPERDE